MSTTVTLQSSLRTSSPRLAQPIGQAIAGVVAMSLLLVALSLAALVIVFALGRRNALQER